MKKLSMGLVLATSMAVAFSLGYSMLAKAYPAGGIYGRGEWRGFFSNNLDTSGTYVLPPVFNNGGTMEAFPSYINTAQELIDFLEPRLGAGYTTQQKTGAAFIINTMSGILGPSSTRTPSAAQLTTWENIVKTAEAHGRVNWRTNMSYVFNSYYQGASGGSCAGCADNDDAFYDNVDSNNNPVAGNSPAMVFRDTNGVVIYAIKWLCANPVGNGFNYFVTPWDATGRSTVSDGNPDPGDTSTAITTRPGDTLTFNHYIKNNGPGATGVDQIMYNITYYPSGVIWVGNTNSGTYTANQEKNLSSPQTINVPLGAPPGTQYCLRISWDWKNSWGERWGTGVPACATVVSDYNLTPTVTVNQTTAQDGDTVIFTYKIQNTGSSASPNAQCYNTNESGTAIGTVFTCSASQVFAGNSGLVTVGTETITIASETPGTTLCRVLHVLPASSTVPNRPSTTTCVVIAKTPYVRFGGNDVWAGGGFASINPSCNTSAKITTAGRALSGTVPTQYAGSSVEYSAFALNKITSFGSAGWALVGAGAVGSVPRSLSFANNEADATKLGYYGVASHCLTDYASLYGSATPLAGGAYDVSTRGSGVWRVSSGNLTLHGTMPAGATQIYLGDNTVTIDGDLKYSASYANIGALPSLVVITNANINVLAGVRQLDGYYIAQGDGATTGMFRDCWPKTSPQAVGDACDTNQLVVNGAVTAAYLELWRSYGALGPTVADRKTPAELFNFNPEIYLRNALSNTSSPLVQVVNTIELPPRF